MAQQTSLVLNIASVERDTGLSKDTLRVWERRYGFPAPTRDPIGERIYSVEQLEKLRTLKRLLDLGHRPGKIVGLPMGELQRLAQASGNAAARGLDRAESTPDLSPYVGLLKRHHVEELRSQLLQALLRNGLARFIIDTIAPLNERVGEAWTRGAVEIHEEHLYTETVQGILRGAIGSMPRPGARPRVLLTTFPQEPHGLGILMAEAMFALNGCDCVSLGVRTPVRDILQAASAQRADIVALSFSAAVSANQVLAGLADLRAELAPSVEIWAGGSCPALHRRRPDGVTTLRVLEEIEPQVQRWRQANEAKA